MEPDAAPNLRMRAIGAMEESRVRIVTHTILRSQRDDASGICASRRPAEMVRAALTAQFINDDAATKRRIVCVEASRNNVLAGCRLIADDPCNRLPDVARMKKIVKPGALAVNRRSNVTPHRRPNLTPLA
jgi:hypothetical protein